MHLAVSVVDYFTKTPNHGDLVIKNNKLQGIVTAVNSKKFMYTSILFDDKSSTRLPYLKEFCKSIDTVSLEIFDYPEFLKNIYNRENILSFIVDPIEYRKTIFAESDYKFCNDIRLAVLYDTYHKLKSEIRKRQLYEIENRYRYMDTTLTNQFLLADMSQHPKYSILPLVVELKSVLRKVLDLTSPP